MREGRREGGREGGVPVELLTIKTHLQQVKYLEKLITTFAGTHKDILLLCYIAFQPCSAGCIIIL